MKSAGANHAKPSMTGMRYVLSSRAIKIAKQATGRLRYQDNQLRKVTISYDMC